MQRLGAFSGFCAVVTVGFCYLLASEQFDDLAARAPKSIQVQGIAVAINENGKVIARQPVDLDTGGLGSNNNAFTATAMGILRRDRRIIRQR